MTVRESVHQNSVFHLCALKGHLDMWAVLLNHLMVSIAALFNLNQNEDEIKLEVRRTVGSMLNKYGLTPLQVAAYKNHTKMVESILNWNRILIWK